MITSRDFEVLKFLFYVKYCDTDTLGGIFYRWNNGRQNKQYLTITRRRLKELREQKLIKSYLNTENGPALHTLTNKGALYVGHTLGVPTDYWKEPKGFVSRGTAKHSLELAKVYSKLLYDERMGRYTIQEIKLERQNREEILIGNQTAIIQPDIFLRIWKLGNEHSFFIEVDCMTERKNKVEEKIRRYEKYYRRRNRKETLIFYCDNQTRIKQLQGVVNTWLPVEFRLKGESII